MLKEFNFGLKGIKITLTFINTTLIYIHMTHLKSLTIILLILILIPSTLAQEIKIKTFVNDYAEIISPEEELELNSILTNLYEKDIAEFAVVTIVSLEGKDIESYSLSLAQEVLGDENNNGLLLLVSLEDKKYRFEVGRGLEATLNDAKVGRIGREILVENFRNDEYGKGIVEAAKTISGILVGDIEYEEENSDSSTISSVAIILFVYFIFIMFSLIINTIRKKKQGDDYYNSALGGAILLGSLGRGGRGGFGGFGGGSFGGGGASGGW